MFHRLCDGRGATLTVIKGDQRTHIFGGYNSASWTSSRGWSHAPAWLFGLRAGSKPVKLYHQGKLAAIHPFIPPPSTYFNLIWCCLRIIYRMVMVMVMVWYDMDVNGDGL
jgi:hypothetical protein